MVNDDQVFSNRFFKLGTKETIASFYVGLIQSSIVQEIKDY